MVLTYSHLFEELLPIKDPHFCSQVPSSDPAMYGLVCLLKL